MHLHLEPFGDFEGQPAAGYAGLAKDCRNRRREPGRLELDRRDVDADDTDVVVHQQLAAHRSYCPAPELQDGAGSLRDGNEQARRHRVPSSILRRIRASTASTRPDSTFWIG